MDKNGGGKYKSIIHGYTLSVLKDVNPLKDFFVDFTNFGSMTISPASATNKMLKVDAPLYLRLKGSLDLLKFGYSGDNFDQFALFLDAGFQLPYREQITVPYEYPGTSPCFGYPANTLGIKTGKGYDNSNAKRESSTNYLHNNVLICNIKDLNLYDIDLMIPIFYHLDVEATGDIILPNFIHFAFLKHE